MKDVSVAEVESSCEMGFTGYDPIYLSVLLWFIKYYKK